MRSRISGGLRLLLVLFFISTAVLKMSAIVRTRATMGGGEISIQMLAVFVECGLAAAVAMSRFALLGALFAAVIFLGAAIGATVALVVRGPKSECHCLGDVPLRETQSLILDGAVILLSCGVALGSPRATAWQVHQDPPSTPAL